MPAFSLPFSFFSLSFFFYWEAAEQLNREWRPDRDALSTKRVPGIQHRTQNSVSRVLSGGAVRPPCALFPLRCIVPAHFDRKYRQMPHYFRLPFRFPFSAHAELHEIRPLQCTSLLPNPSTSPLPSPLSGGRGTFSLMVPDAR